MSLLYFYRRVTRFFVYLLKLNETVQIALECYVQTLRENTCIPMALLLLSCKQLRESRKSRGERLFLFNDVSILRMYCTDKLVHINLDV